MAFFSQKFGLGGLRLLVPSLLAMSLLLSSCSTRDTSLDDKSMEELLQSELLELDWNSGDLVEASLPDDTRWVLFYASASWCGPCQNYTPALREWYEKTQKQGSKFEVVLVSGDFSPESLQAYVEKTAMPWKVLSFAASDSLAMVNFKGPYPSSYLVNLETGELVDQDAGAQGVGGRKLHSTVASLEEQLAKL